MLLKRCRFGPGLQSLSPLMAVERPAASRRLPPPYRSLKSLTGRVGANVGDTLIQRAALGWSLLTEVVALTAPAQRAALMQLYTATNGTTWNNKTGWQSSNDPCDDGWAGVICDGGSGVVSRNV
jgi:hypothetical protein